MLTLGVILLVLNAANPFKSVPVSLQFVRSSLDIIKHFIPLSLALPYFIPPKPIFLFYSISLSLPLSHSLYIFKSLSLLLYPSQTYFSLLLSFSFLNVLTILPFLLLKTLLNFRLASLFIFSPSLFLSTHPILLDLLPIPLYLLPNLSLFLCYSLIPLCSSLFSQSSSLFLCFLLLHHLP